MEINLDAIISGGVMGSIIAGLFAATHILLNKRIRTPADEEASRRADIVERNEILVNYKEDLSTAKEDIKGLKAGQEALEKKTDEQETEIGGLRVEVRIRDDYIWRCIRVIRRIGTDEDVPKPYPDGYVA